MQIFVDAAKDICYIIVDTSKGGGFINAAKIETLKSNGSYNRHASAVISPLFAGNEHFDPHDLVQVKYEMLRAVLRGEMTVSEASRQFGFSRTAYYNVEKSYGAAGVGGLFLQKTGPKSAAKATDEILQFADELRAGDPDITNDQIIKEIRSKKGVSLHKRSLQRERSKKKRARAGNSPV
jgi:transposase